MSSTTSFPAVSYQDLANAPASDSVVSADSSHINTPLNTESSVDLLIGDAQVMDHFYLNISNFLDIFFVLISFMKLCHFFPPC